MLNDKLEQSEEKIKLLESNVTKLNQMTEKWKKGNSLDDNTLMVLHRWKWIIGYIRAMIMFLKNFMRLAKKYFLFKHHWNANFNVCNTLAHLCTI